MRNVDIHLGLLEHRDDGLGQLLVVIIGERIDEVNDPRAGQLRVRAAQTKP